MVFGWSRRTHAHLFISIVHVEAKNGDRIKKCLKQIYIYRSPKVKTFSQCTFSYTRIMLKTKQSYEILSHHILDDGQFQQNSKLSTKLDHGLHESKQIRKSSLINYLVTHSKFDECASLSVTIRPLPSWIEITIKKLDISITDFLK